MGYALGRESFDGIFPPVSHPLDPANVQMMGLRSIDPPEHELIHALGMDVWDMRRIDEEGVSAPTNAFLERVAKAGGRLHVISMSISWTRSSPPPWARQFLAVPLSAKRI